jgi:hypothetical protein
MADRHKQPISYPVRMPPDLRKVLQSSADRARRTLHAEIVLRLEDSVRQQPVAKP